MRKKILFKYNPNIYNNPIVYHNESKCQCCSEMVDDYISSMYSAENIECICLECVASGKASKKFNGTFVQAAMPLKDVEKKEELFCRTPGYTSWQGEYWLTCCDDYCAFLETVGTKELDELGIADEVIDEYEKRNKCNIVREYLTKDGSLCGYLFRCLHCGKYHLGVDAD